METVVHEIQVDSEVFRRPGTAPLQDLKASLAKEARKVSDGRRVKIKPCM